MLNLQLKRRESSPRLVKAIKKAKINLESKDNAVYLHRQTVKVLVQ